MMHQSVFRYNLSRPYPYPWLPQVVIFSGIIATALLSSINIAANGYEARYENQTCRPLLPSHRQLIHTSFVYINDHNATDVP